MEDIRWVKGPNGPVACEPGASGFCYECGGRMVFRRGCKRKRGNTEWTVRDHFMHMAMGGSAAAMALVSALASAGAAII